MGRSPSAETTAAPENNTAPQLLRRDRPDSIRAGPFPARRTGWEDIAMEVVKTFSETVTRDRFRIVQLYLIIIIHIEHYCPA